MLSFNTIISPYIRRWHATATNTICWPFDLGCTMVLDKTLKTNLNYIFQTERLASRSLIFTRFPGLYSHKYTKNLENILNVNGDLLTSYAGTCVCGDGVLVSENGLVRKSSTQRACGSKTTHKSRNTETKQTHFTNTTPSPHCCCSCAWLSYSSCWFPGESGFETTMGPGLVTNKHCRMHRALGLYVQTFHMCIRITIRFYIHLLYLYFRILHK